MSQDMELLNQLASHASPYSQQTDDHVSIALGTNSSITAGSRSEGTSSNTEDVISSEAEIVDMTEGYDSNSSTDTEYDY